MKEKIYGILAITIAMIIVVISLPFVLLIVIHDIIIPRKKSYSYVGNMCMGE